MYNGGLQCKRQWLTKSANALANSSPLHLWYLNITPAWGQTVMMASSKLKVTSVGP